MRDQTARYLLIALGWICVGLGIIGLFVPMMPGAVFIILAAYCFNRSSEKFHTWLVEHNVFGPILKAWYEGKGIDAKTRNLILLSLWLCLSITGFVMSRTWVWWFVAVIGIGVSAYIIHLSMPQDEDSHHSDVNS
jgi:uncharacterized membrane protein YbaN (DUF454 family)